MSTWKAAYTKHLAAWCETFWHLRELLWQAWLLLTNEKCKGTASQGCVGRHHPLEVAVVLSCCGTSCMNVPPALAIVLRQLPRSHPLNVPQWSKALQL